MHRYDQLIHWNEQLGARLNPIVLSRDPRRKESASGPEVFLCTFETENTHRNYFFMEQNNILTTSKQHQNIWYKEQKISLSRKILSEWQSQRTKFRHFLTYFKIVHPSLKTPNNTDNFKTFTLHGRTPKWENVTTPTAHHPTSPLNKAKWRRGTRFWKRSY